MSDNPQKKYLEDYRLADASVASEVVLVTPELAESWLKFNLNNRPLSPFTVNRYTKYIEDGKWMFNGEPVIFADDGTLMDGQNRLNAIMGSGISVPVLVVRGVRRGAFVTLDQGKIRSAADVLATQHVKQQKTVASALNWLFRYETRSMLANGVRLSNGEVLSLLAEFPDIVDSAAYVTEKALRGIHTPGPWTFLHYACLKRRPERANFFEQVMTGANLDPESPAFRLYNWLVNAKKVGGHTIMETVKMLAVAAKAWNYTITGRSVVLLRWTNDEPFPEIL